jgi:Tol biopolymer transport system component
MIGRTIGNYQVTAELGAGGMGQVYRARDAKLDRDVAIKVVPDIFSGDAERLARFEREARLLATLNHPGIGAVYELEEEQGHRFLIMELVEGEDLSARIARGPIALDEALDMALQIASALEAAHEQGIVHRDLKPANIRVTEEGRIKVLDFGLAKALDPADGSSPTALTQSPTAFLSSPTVAGVILGTAAYMSPEQARGKRVDKRADTFAFGVVLWEMLTGRPLFAGDTVTDTLAAILRETPDLETLPATTPRAVKTLLARCLEKDPRRRLRDIGEARILIEDVRSGAARDGDAPAIARRYGLRAHAGWLAAAVMLVVAVLAVMTRPEIALPPSQVRRASMVMSHDDASFRRYFTPCVSPDGRYVAFASHDEIWLRDLTQLHARPIPGTERGTSPFWSPDGEWIGFGRESALMRVKRDGGEPSLIATLPLGMSLEGTGSAVWDEQGSIVIGPNTSGLQLVSARGGEVTHWVPPGPNESDFHEVCLLPGSHGYVAVLHSSTGIGDLVLVTPDAKRKPIMHIDDTVVSPTYSPSGHLLFERRGTTDGIWAIAYDLERQECVGDPFLVVPGGKLPSASSDGTLCYVDGVTAPQSQLVWIDRSGALVGKIGPPDFTTRPFPAISPDGRTVAMSNRFGDSRETFLYDLEAGTRRRLTFTDYAEEVPRWHPNGVDILDYCYVPAAMYEISTSAGTPPRALGTGIMPAVSPDGTTLVYAVQRPGEWNFDILVRPVDADSTEARDLIKTPTVDWWPSFSPDGEFLMYVSASSGRDEVYVTTFPEPSTLWQISTNGGNVPRWRSDGREIFFTTTDEIWAVDVTPGDGSLVVGTPHRLCKRPTTNWSGRWPDGFDVSPDGQRILVLQPIAAPSDTPPAIVVVQNWFEEFRDR